MQSCPNPQCQNPFNPDSNKFCQSCGTSGLNELFRNRYRVIKVLGAGGFGRTYLAEDAERLDSPCVIKQFAPQVQGTSALEKATELFKQEARQLYELGEHHQQIPRLIAYFEHGKSLYLVQEFIQGQTLLEEVEKQAFNEQQIREVLADLLPVLSYIHSQNVIHRDLKPENIIRRQKDGKLVLIDFGGAKQITQTSLANPGTKLFTIGYAPIEQMVGKAIPASDLYALGATCARLLTQCLPTFNAYGDCDDRLYDAESVEWLWKERLKERGVTVSQELERILDKLLQHLPKDRYQSADEALKDLNAPTLTTPYQGQAIGGNKSNQSVGNINTLLQPENSNAQPLQPQLSVNSTVNLVSAIGINYSTLNQLLAAEKWKEADEETGKIMLKIANRKEEGWLRSEDIDYFPCDDLQIIDQLWVKHSNGHFGLSIQKRIYESLGGTCNFDSTIWDAFGEQVGWLVNNSWLSKSEITFSLNSHTPLGHLPISCDGVPHWGMLGVVRVVNLFASRLANCKNLKAPPLTPSHQATGNVNNSPPIKPSTINGGKKTSLPLTTFEFDVVRVDARGKIINRQRQKAQYFAEDLGNGVILKMVAIPEGEFLMGSSDTEFGKINNEKPKLKVKVLPFLIGQTTVTQAQWLAVAALPQINNPLNSEPSYFKGANRPVEQVSWDDAIEFCARLSKKTGREYFLPSEARWEYACRAGTTTPFHFGETITPELANYDGNYSYGSGSKGKYRRETTPVGCLGIANAFGLYDMHGNVYEWCADPWHNNYKNAPSDGSVWELGGDEQRRMLRGGSWYSNPRSCRSAFRYDYNPDFKDNNIGLRVVCAAV